MQQKEELSKYSIIYFFEYISVVKLKDKVIIVTKLQVVDGCHKHNFCNSKFFNPTLVVSFYS